MEAINIDVVPDSYIRNKVMKVAIIIAALMTFGILFWAVMDDAIIVLITEAILSAILIVAMLYAEYIRRPLNLRITSEGVTLFFKHLKPRSYSWHMIREVRVLKQIPKMKGKMPTRGGVFFRDIKYMYFMDEGAALEVLKAYTEIHGHPPMVISSVEGSTRWEINPA